MICFKKEVWHNLMLGKTDRFAKIIFYFLRGHTDSKIIITDKRVNLGDKKGMQVPWNISLYAY